MSTKLLLQGLVVITAAMYVVPNITNNEPIRLDSAIVLAAMCIIGFILLNMLFPGIENYDSKAVYEADVARCQNALDVKTGIMRTISEFKDDLKQERLPRSALYWYMRGRYPGNDMLRIALGVVSDDDTMDTASNIVDYVNGKLSDKKNQYLLHYCAEYVRKDFDMV